MRYPSTLTIDIDICENKELQFPKAFTWWDQARVAHMMRVTPSVVHLPTADYTFHGYDHIVLAERKGAIRELNTNLFTKDRRRAMSVFDRMVEECEYPTLLLDIPRSAAFRPGDQYCRHPRRTVDGIFREMLARGIHILWLPPSTSQSPHQSGELLLRWMWQCIYYHRWIKGASCTPNSASLSDRLLGGVCPRPSPAPRSPTSPATRRRRPARRRSRSSSSS